MKIKVSYDNTQRFDAKPSGNGALYTSINNGIVNNWTSITLPKFAEVLGNGHCWSGGRFHGAKKATRWHSQQVFGIDVDELSSPTPEQAIAITEDLLGIKPSIVYRSFSSDSTNNKYRVIMAADEVLTDPLVCLSILRAFNHVLQGDRATIDLARMYYGTTSDKIMLVNDHLTPTNALIDFASRYGKPSTPVRKYADEDNVELTAAKDYTINQKQKLKQELHLYRLRLRKLYKGSRYMSLWSATNALTHRLKSQLLPTEEFIAVATHLFGLEQEQNEYWNTWDKIEKAEDIILSAYNEALKI